MARVLPHFIQHRPRSEELVCLHEGGHVQFILAARTLPEFVEIVQDAEPYGRTRALQFTGRRKRVIAVAGYAVELYLHKAARLVDANGNGVSDKLFIQEAVANHAANDKIMFFGENRELATGCWPRTDDQRFMECGDRMLQFLNVAFLNDFATELLNKQRLGKAEIERIGRRHGVIQPRLRRR